MLPEAVTLKVTVAPTLVVTFCGWAAIAGAAITVNTALELSVMP